MNSMIDFMMSLTPVPENSEMNTAAATPRGTDTTNATAVTRRDPRISGNIPNLPGFDVGYQAVPDSIDPSPASLSARTEFKIRNSAMAARMMMASQPHT